MVAPGVIPFHVNFVPHCGGSFWLTWVGVPADVGEGSHPDWGRRSPARSARAASGLTPQTSAAQREAAGSTKHQHERTANQEHQPGAISGRGVSGGGSQQRID